MIMVNFFLVSSIQTFIVLNDYGKNLSAHKGLNPSNISIGINKEVCCPLSVLQCLCARARQLKGNCSSHLGNIRHPSEGFQEAFIFLQQGNILISKTLYKLKIVSLILYMQKLFEKNHKEAYLHFL